MAKKIVIADDEAHIRLLLQQTLESFEDEGVEILTAENGRQGYEIIQSERPELVFLDVMMPYMNGYDVCSAIKKDAELANTYVILLTAKGQEADRNKGIEVGADLFMTKPFDPDLIVDTAQKVLGL